MLSVCPQQLCQAEHEGEVRDKLLAVHNIVRVAENDNLLHKHVEEVGDGGDDLLHALAPVAVSPLATNRTFSFM